MSRQLCRYKPSGRRFKQKNSAWMHLKIEHRCHTMRLTREAVNSLELFLTRLGLRVSIFPGVNVIRHKSVFRKGHFMHELTELGLPNHTAQHLLHELTTESSQSPNHSMVPPAFFEETFQCIPCDIRLFTLLRWQDGPLLLQLFSSMRHYMTQTQPGVHESVQPRMHHIKSMYYLSKLIQPRGSIIPRLDSIRREELVQVISSHPSCKYAVSFLKAVCSFTKGGRWGRWLTWGGWHPITNRGVGFHSNKRRRQRSVFTEHEINSLFDHFRKTGNLRATTHLRFFMHTGARHRAVSLLKVCDVMHQNGEVCDKTTLYEKFGKMRTVTVDPLLAKAIRLYVNQRGLPRNAYLFHKMADVRQYTLSGRWLHSACTQCGISGDHVYIHALHRTVITWLFKAGLGFVIVIGALLADQPDVAGCIFFCRIVAAFVLHPEVDATFIGTKSFAPGPGDYQGQHHGGH